MKLHLYFLLLSFHEVINFCFHFISFHESVSNFCPCNFFFILYHFMKIFISVLYLFNFQRIFSPVSYLNNFMSLFSLVSNSYFFMRISYYVSYLYHFINLFSSVSNSYNFMKLFSWVYPPPPSQPGVNVVCIAIEVAKWGDTVTGLLSPHTVKMSGGRGWYSPQMAYIIVPSYQQEGHYRLRCWKLEKSGEIKCYFKCQT